MFFTAVSSQELRLVVSDQPLNTVLNMLNVEISFDDAALSMHKVTISQTFRSPEEAIHTLLKDTPFKVEKIGNVYVVSPIWGLETEVRKRYIVSGELLDQATGEALPYGYIQTPKGIVSTNQTGYFSIVGKANEALRIQIQYMGFETLDTLLYAGKHKLLLTPKAIVLEEVVTTPTSSAMLMQMGKTAGETRINHQIARHIPGNADNSVFNLMRLMPGVRASGEPSEDLIVWGSNWGESRLKYDGFTIFGMKNFNNQIGSVNPYLVKDIRLLKGGYGASKGNRIGAIAEITGNEGYLDRPSVKANLSNYTANIYTTIPVTKASALLVAYRQTFYNLYDAQNIGNFKGGESNSETSPDIYISPRYDFRDLNVKYAGKALGNDRYYVSLYTADDHSKFSVKQEAYQVDATEKNKQYGAATSYNRIWNNGSNSKLLFAYSELSAAIDNVSRITDAPSPSLGVFYLKNKVQELSFNLEHGFNIGQRQKIKMGVGWQYYSTSYNKHEDRVNNLAWHITDNILLGKLSLKAGIRTDMVLNDKIYVQPRLSARYMISDELAATASWGLYKQFLTRIPYQYYKGSYQFVWDISDSTSLSATHFLMGLAYSKKGWLISTEGFLKKSGNQLYYVDNTIYERDNTNIGFDIFAKKEWQGKTLLGSYSIVNSMNPQESTGHEIKLGAIYLLSPFHLSATYVYGQGFPYLSTGGHGHRQNNEEQQHGEPHKHSDISTAHYSRLDLSLIYKWQLKKISMQAGASVLNVFDTSNVKYSYRLSNQDDVFNVYTKATPFTTVVFLEIIF